MWTLFFVPPNNIESRLRPFSPAPAHTHACAHTHARTQNHDRAKTRARSPASTEYRILSTEY